LMIGFQLAGIEIESDHRGRVEIVSGAGALRLVIGAGPIVERRRVGGAPQDRVGLGVVSTRHPAAASASPPGITAPGLLRFVGPGDGEEFPLLLAGRGIDSEDRAAARPFAALRADHDGALGVERRTGEADGQLLRVDQLVSQATFPVFMSSAINRPSIVPTKTLPSPNATPRL